MTRVKSSVTSRNRRRRILKAAQGYKGTRRRLYRAAKEAVRHALKYAFMHRRHRKGDFRRIWISRINAASRANGMTYSRFSSGLKHNKIELNRKVLAELAIKAPEAFAEVVAAAKG